MDDGLAAVTREHNIKTNGVGALVIFGSLFIVWVSGS
jgi:hypothetical protein